MNEVTKILCDAERGDQRAQRELFAAVYDELHRLAGQKMLHEAPGHTLQATALVHEAYLRLVGTEQAQRWNSRGHFFAAAAEAMRRILVESARRRHALQRGGGWQRVELDDVEPVAPDGCENLLALNAALEKLEQQERTKAQLVKLRYFAGLTMEQSAEARGISEATAYRYWNYARAWLHQEVAGKDAPLPDS